MGSCASAQRKSYGSSSRKLRPSLVHSETDKHSNTTPFESVKEKPEVVAGVTDQPISSSHGYASRVSPLNSVSSFSNYGSKEETFFDTQAWIESDCDDEFYSVNGDFTPSRGNTPLYRSIPGTPVNRNLSFQVNRALFEGRSPPYYAAESNRSSSRGTTPLHRRSASAAAPRLDSDNIVATTTNSPPPEQKKKKSKKLGDLFRESITEESAAANSESYVQNLTESQPERAVNKEKHAQGCLPRLNSARFLRKVMAPQVAVDA